MTMTTPATTPADGELLPAPTTYMNEDDARHWAWQHAKKDLGTDNLSIGENASNMAFFISGWAYKGQYESQRAPESFEQWFDQTSGFTEHDEAVARAAWQACAALATPSPGKAQEPVAWFEAEETTRGADLRDIINSIVHSTRWHWQAERPKTNNPVWPVYASPGKADAEDGLRCVAEKVVAAWDEAATAEQWDENRYDAFVTSGAMEALRAEIQQGRSKQ